MIEKATIYLFLPKNFNLTVCLDKNIKKYSLESFSDQTADIINSAQLGDWFVVQEANEIITSPPNIANSVSSVQEFLLKATKENLNFNAISVSTIYINDYRGQGYQDMPFKVHSPGAWDRWLYKISLLPVVNTFKGTVKVWKKINTDIKISFLMSRANYSVVCEVLFPGRNIYPYTLLSVRYAGNITIDIENIGIIKDKTHLMYGYYFYTGYWNYARSSMMEINTLY